MGSRCTKPGTFTHTSSRPLESVLTAFLLIQLTWSTNNGELQLDLNSMSGLLPCIGITSAHIQLLRNCNLSLKLVEKLFIVTCIF